MVELPHDICAQLDEMVFAFGPAAVFPGRPATLGQQEGSAFDVVGGVVVVDVPTSVTHMLSRRALAAADHVGRRRRQQLIAFSAGVRSKAPLPVTLCAAMLGVLAHFGHVRRGTYLDRLSDLELLVAVYELVSRTQLASR